MASQHKRSPINVSGDFFVDSGCIDSGTCDRRHTSQDVPFYKLFGQRVGRVKDHSVCALFVPFNKVYGVTDQRRRDAGYRFATGKVVETPFSGFMEIPLGIAWKASDNAVLVAEGGFAIPFTGGDLGLAAAWRL